MATLKTMQISLEKGKIALNYNKLGNKYRHVRVILKKSEKLNFQEVKYLQYIALEFG